MSDNSAFPRLAGEKMRALEKRVRTLEDRVCGIMWPRPKNDDEVRTDAGTEFRVGDRVVVSKCEYGADVRGTIINRSIDGKQVEIESWARDLDPQKPRRYWAPATSVRVEPRAERQKIAEEMLAYFRDHLRERLGDAAVVVDVVLEVR